jgi:hypothetical protein
MSIFNFTKVLKYTAGMAGLYFLEKSSRAETRNNINTHLGIQIGILKVKQNTTYQAALLDTFNMIDLIMKNITTLADLRHQYKQVLGSLGANLFDNYVTQNEYVDCTISKYITQSYISNKWVQYAAMIVPSAILWYAFGTKFEKVFIESCILKAISDDYEDKVDVEVQPEDLNVSIPELLH